MSKDKSIFIDLPELGKHKITFDILLLDQQEALGGKPIHDIWTEAERTAQSTTGFIKYVSTIVLSGIRANYLREEKDIDTLPNQYKFLTIFGEWVKEKKIVEVGKILEVYSGNIGEIVGVKVSDAKSSALDTKKK